MPDQLANQNPTAAPAAAASQGQVLGSLFGVDQSLLGVQVPLDNPQIAGWGVNGPRTSSTTTVARALANFHRLSNDQRDAAASQLEAAGYLPAIPAGSKKKRNPDSIYNAYRDALLDSVSAGVPVTKWLSDQASNATGASSDQSSKATNPLDAQALGNTTALASLGYGLSPDQQTQFAGQFAAAEAPYNQSNATTAAPTAQGWAQWARQNVREIDPKRFDALQVVHTMDAIRQLLGSSDTSTGRAPSPDTQVNQ